MRTILISALAIFSTVSCQAQKETEMKDIKVVKTEQEWKEQLTPEQYYILRESGTERPHSSEYDLNFKDGVYSCAGCGTELFKSDDKFDAHCGWPSFDKAISDETVVEITDRSHGMIRTEIRCATCGGHLGHVFNDGPTETGMRYCINGAALEFDEESDENKSE